MTESALLLAGKEALSVIWNSQPFWGLMGVLVGSFLSIWKDLILEQRNRARLATYAAIRIVCVLDVFVDGCLLVARDDGEYEEDEQGNTSCEFTAEPPVLPAFANDIDWKSLEPALLYKILSFPIQIEEANRSISFVANVIATPPDYEEYYEARQLAYAELGISALALNKELRLKYSLASKVFEDGSSWDPAVELPKIKSRLEKAREAERGRQRSANLANSKDGGGA